MNNIITQTKLGSQRSALRYNNSHYTFRC